MKAAQNPTNRAGRAEPVISSGVLARSNAVAANIVGIANRKENNVAVFRGNPMDSPPMIVAPDRETPGKIARD